MNKEEKELLLKDLSRRIPYGVKINAPSVFISCERLSGICGNSVISESGDYIPIECYPRPYLRPLSSLTEEEDEMYRKTGIKITPFEDYPKGFIWVPTPKLTIEFMLERHLDYLGLIDKNLAIDATPYEYIYEF